MADLCDICGGELQHNCTADLEIWHNGELIVLRGLPADVCSQCGEAYFSAETSEKLDRFLAEYERHRPLRYIPVPEYDAETILA